MEHCYSNRVADKAQSPFSLSEVKDLLFQEQCNALGNVLADSAWDGTMDGIDSCPDTHVVYGSYPRVGCSDFVERMEDNCCFVDKSLFIKDVLETTDTVNVFLRPSRFGKSLNLSMLKAFFDVHDSDIHRQLFSDLLIYKHHPQLFQSDGPFGKHPVIYLDLKMRTEMKWPEVRSSIVSRIAKLYRQFDYVLLSDEVDDNESLKSWFIHYNQTRDDNKENMSKCLGMLARAISTYHGSSCVILVDNYDSPLEQTCDGFDDVQKSLESLLFNSIASVKPERKSIFKVVVMGTSLISGSLNGVANVKVYSWAEEEFSEYFGFLNQEAASLVQHYKPDFMTLKRVLNWYAYSTVTQVPISSPWTIASLCEQTGSDSWTNSIGSVPQDAVSQRKYSQIFKYFDRTSYEGLEFILSLLHRRVSAPESIGVYQFIKKHRAHYKGYLNKDEVFNMLLTEGYLVVRSHDMCCIPNLDIAFHWLKWIAPKLDCEVLAEHLINRDFEDLETDFKGLMEQFTFCDVADDDWGQHFFSLFTLRLLSVSLLSQYEVSIDTRKRMLRFTECLASASRSISIEFRIVSECEDAGKAASIALHAHSDAHMASCSDVREVIQVGVSLKGKQVSTVAQSMKMQINGEWKQTKAYPLVQNGVSE